MWHMLIITELYTSLVGNTVARSFFQQDILQTVQYIIYSQLKKSNNTISVVSDAKPITSRIIYFNDTEITV